MTDNMNPASVNFMQLTVKAAFCVILSVITTVRPFQGHRLKVRDIALTVKPFNLAALKVSDFACKIILAPFILAN